MPLSSLIQNQYGISYLLNLPDLHLFASCISAANTLDQTISRTWTSTVYLHPPSLSSAQPPEDACEHLTRLRPSSALNPPWLPPHLGKSQSSSQGTPSTLHLLHPRYVGRAKNVSGAWINILQLPPSCLSSFSEMFWISYLSEKWASWSLLAHVASSVSRHRIKKL